MALITMMFTDVVESSATKRDTSLGRDNRERDHAYLTQVQTPHFELVRACCNAHGGREVTTMGDAFFLAFDDPAEAVRCAAHIQQRLSKTPIQTPRGPLRLRIGIHSGFPEFFEGSWHGTDVDTTARVEAAATERQILISARTYEITRDMTDAKFYSCGEFALKGVGNIALWEVDWDGQGPRRTAALPVGEMRRRRQRRLVAVAAAVLVAVSAGYGVRRYVKAREDGEVLLPVKARQSVAVLGFKNLGSADEAWLADAVPEMLSTELAAGAQLRTISGEDIAKTTADLNVARMPSYGKSTLAKLRSILKSDYVVAGSYVAAGNQRSDAIRLDMRLQEASSGDIVTSFSEDGNIGTLAEMLQRAGAAMRAKLRIQEPSESASAQAQAALPANPEAARLYSEGLAKLRTFDALGARDPLERAIVLEPNLAAAHSALAQAWQMLGYDANAREQAKKAVELSRNLSQVDQRSIEGRYRELTSEWDKAIEIYHSLWGVFQDEPNYALELAKAQTAAGKGQDAMATLAELQRVPEMKDDPRIDLARAFAAESLSDVKLQQSAAAAAAERASALGSRYLAAQAYWQECVAFHGLGDLQKAMLACQQSAAAAPFALEIEARTKSMQARILVAQGQTAEAQEMFRQVLETAGKIGSQKDVIGALMNLANLQATEGQTAQAEKNEREAIEIAKQIGDKRQLLDLENDLASDLNTEGDYQRARGLFEDSLTTARDIGDQGGISAALQNLGAQSLQMGELTLAEKNVREALKASQDAHLQDMTASGLNTLGDIELVKGNFAEARKNYESGLQLFTVAGDQPDIASTRLSLSKLALEEGKFSEAESLARQAIQEFRTDKLTDNEADARNTLARCLISEGKLTDAQGEIESAGKIAVQDFAIRISLAITAARIKARNGKIEEAQRDLNSQLKEAKARNLVGLQFEIRLALAENAAPADLKSKGALLAALDQDARNSGYLLVAGKAERFKTSPSQ
jgi:class 3 adenylate cyclase/tetratricopeptide (TPR) repeat protein